MARLPGSKDTVKRTRQKKDPGEKKVTINVYVKKKHVEKAVKLIKPIVDKLNSK
jgi:hypothetical protein